MSEMSEMKGEKGGERVPVPVAGPAFRGGVYFVLFKLFGCVLEFAFEVVSIESTFSPVCNAGLCLQQQHVEVGDRLSVDAQELQFTSQSICQLSNLKLPGERAESRATLWEQHRAAAAQRLLGNTAQDHPRPLSLAGLGRATLALCACHPLC